LKRLFTADLPASLLGGDAENAEEREKRNLDVDACKADRAKLSFGLA
jgi:hypothetical protein